MPTTTLCTTRDTMMRLGIHEDREVDNVQEYTVRRVLAHARSGALLSFPVRAHALYHGLIREEDPSVEMVRLDVGGWGFQLPRAFLMETFVYFRAMFTGLFREAAQSEEHEVFIDRSAEMFQEALSVAAGERSLLFPELSEELLFYGYVDPAASEKESALTAQTLRDAHNEAISFDAVWKLILKSLKDRAASLRMGYARNDGLLKYHFSNRTSAETRDRILEELRSRGFTAEIDEPDHMTFPALTVTW